MTHTAAPPTRRLHISGAAKWLVQPPFVGFALRDRVNSARLRRQPSCRRDRAVKRFVFVAAAAAVPLLSISASPAEAVSSASKLVICHIPQGNPVIAHTLVVGESAMRGHLAHGDTLGPCPDYPPAAGLLLTPGKIQPGATFEATFEGCPGGETVDFVLNGTTTSAPCNVPAGPAGFRRPSVAELPSATATLRAPTTPGTYTFSATGATTGLSATATIAVATATPDGLLPTTGSDSAPIVQVGAGLFATAACLTVVGIRRRRAHA